MLTTDLLAQLVPGATLPRQGDTDRSASGVAFDSRRVRPGDIFFALPGARTHGIDYAEDALRRGAAFLVSDRPHPRAVRVPDPAAALLALGRHAREQLPGPVIGITGSAGKTTTKTFVAAALDAPASPGNFNTPWALAVVLVDAWLASQRPSGNSRPLVLELGIDHPGEMATLLELVRPTHGLVTTIGAAHLERLGDVATVAREKEQLLAASRHRFAGERAAPLLSQEVRAATRIYGFGPEAHIRARRRPHAGGSQELELAGVRIAFPHPGVALAENAVGALAIAQQLGVPLAEAGARVAAATLEPGRLQRRRVGNAIVLDDSYNSNPLSAAAALEVLFASPPPHTAVLGDMLELGDASRRWHRELGRASRPADRVIAVGPEAQALLEENPGAAYAADTAAALPLVRALPREGTVLFKASRGMGFERLVAAYCEGARTERTGAEPNEPESAGPESAGLESTEFESTGEVEA